MTEQYTTEATAETAGRLRRIETKVSRMCVAMGVEEGTTMPLRVTLDSLTGKTVMHLRGVDITLSGIMRYLRASKVVGLTTPLELIVNGEHVADIRFTGD